MDSEDDGPRVVLARNIGKLMAATKGARRDLSSPHRLQANAGLSKSHVYRMLSTEMAATIDSLAEVAAAFGLQTWQLLVPTLDAWQDANGRLCVATPVESTVAPQSESLKRAHAALRELTDEERVALFAAIQAPPVLGHEVEEKIPATKAKPATNADKVLNKLKFATSPVKAAHKKKA